MCVCITLYSIYSTVLVFINSVHDSLLCKKKFFFFWLDNCINGNEDITSTKTMMQASGDLKQYIGYTNAQPLKHLSESSLTLSQSLQIPVSRMHYLIEAIV